MKLVFESAARMDSEWLTDYVHSLAPPTLRLPAKKNSPNQIVAPLQQPTPPQMADHPTTTTAQDQRTAEAREAFTAHLSSVGTHVDSDLQSRAKDIHANSAAIAKQESDVAKQSVALSKQTAQYQKIVDEGRDKLKEIGDVQNWAEMIERDLLVVEETLRRAEEEAGGEGTGRGGEGGRRRWF